MSKKEAKTPSSSEQNIEEKHLPRFVCPIHGIVAGIVLKIDEDTKQEIFSCPVKECTVERKRSECEYP